MKNGNNSFRKIYTLVGNNVPTEDWPESSLVSLINVNNCCLKLTLIDSPGYGNKSDINEWRKSVID